MFDGALVLELFAGKGAMFRHVWSRAHFGACMDVEPEKVAAAAMEREGWACYKGNAIRALEHGFMGHVPWDIVDIDAYGSPWEAVRAWFTSARDRATTTTLIVTDGVWSKFGVGGIPKVLTTHDKEDRKNGWTIDMYFERVRSKLDLWASDAGLAIEFLTIQAPNRVRGNAHAIKMAQYTIRVQNKRGDRSEGIDPNQTEGMAW